MNHAEEAIRFFDWVTLIAVVVGPIIASIAAVYITRAVDEKRQSQARRLDVFKILMRTRGLKLNPEHVGALNLVEIEFYSETLILNALEKYLEHLNTDHKNSNSIEDWIKKADQLFTKMLYQMAKSVGYEIEQLQILTGAYSPRGWEEAEERHSQIQKLLLTILSGRAGLPIIPYTIPSATHGSQNTPNENPLPPGFPPPPV